MKKLCALFLCVMLVCAVGPAFAAEIVVATDLHYISPELTDHGAYFTRLLEQGDGKITAYCDEITDAFVAEVIARKPDALILSGDLTFNGAPDSHRALASKLKAVLDAGIPVLVIPGNHDVYNYNAASFSGDSFTRLGPTTSNTFRTIWHAFGYDGAVACDAGSLSYVYALNDGTRILMLDFNTYEDPCGFSWDTYAWIEEQLKQGIDLVVGHQNLMQHTLFADGYVVRNGDLLCGLLERYGVSLYLSGHMHIQHIESTGSVTDIATSSLCVSPCQYGIVTTDPLTYRAVQLDVEAYAASNGLTDENLLRFSQYAEDYMDHVTLRFAGDLQEPVRTWICETNRRFFSGRLDQTDLDTATLDLVRDQSSYGGTLIFLAEQNMRDHTVWPEK